VQVARRLAGAEEQSHTGILPGTKEDGTTRQDTP
jgi:hypothetical protein